MKAGIVFTGTGPILILTTCESLTDPDFVEKLAAKGIRKFIAHELPLGLVKEKYGAHGFATCSSLCAQRVYGKEFDSHFRIPTMKEDLLFSTSDKKS